jgi:hypothetical protein
MNEKGGMDTPPETVPEQAGDDARTEACSAPASAAPVQPTPAPSAPVQPSLTTLAPAAPTPTPPAPAAPTPAAPTPILPTQSREDTDVGWGDYRDRDDDDHLLRDRPPHWDNT